MTHPQFNPYQNGLDSWAAAIRAIRLFANLVAEAVQEGRLEYQQKLVAGADSLEQAEQIAARQGIELDEKLVARMMADEEKKMAAAAEQAAEQAAAEAGDEFSGAVEEIGRAHV